MTRTWDDMRGTIFDSRDVIERIAELEAQDGPDDGSGLDADEREELVTLRGIAEDGSTVADWEYGETFIPESEFEDYAQQLAEDIGAIPADASWPATHIDWEAAADALKMDYTSLTLDGIDYWAR